LSLELFGQSSYSVLPKNCSNLLISILKRFSHVFEMFKPRSFAFFKTSSSTRITVAFFFPKTIPLISIDISRYKSFCLT